MTNDNVSQPVAARQHTDGLWDIGELAAYLKCSERTIRRYIDTLGLPSKRIAARLLFRRSEIDAWIDSHPEATAAAPTEAA